MTTPMLGPNPLLPLFAARRRRISRTPNGSSSVRLDGVVVASLKKELSVVEPPQEQVSAQQTCCAAIRTHTRPRIRTKERIVKLAINVLIRVENCHPFYIQISQSNTESAHAEMFQQLFYLLRCFRYTFWHVAQTSLCVY